MADERRKLHRPSADSFDGSDRIDFNVRDLLVWSVADWKTEVRDGDNSSSDDSRGFEVSWSVVAVLGVLITFLGGVEAFKRSYLEDSGKDLILVLQHWFPAETALQLRKLFDGLLGFPEDIWGLIPAVLVATIPGWESVTSRIVFLAGVSRITKWILGILFRQGRPFWIYSEVQMWHCPTVYGFPSGHAYLLLVAIAPVLQKIFEDTFNESNSRKPHVCSFIYFSAFSACVLCVYFLCCFGRMFLGTHFPHSIGMGFLCGCLLLSLFSSANVMLLAEYIKSIAHSYDKESVMRQSTKFLLVLTGCALFLYGSLVAIRVVADWIFSRDPIEWYKRSAVTCKTTVLNTSDSEVALRGILILSAWCTVIGLKDVIFFPGKDLTKNCKLTQSSHKLNSYLVSGYDSIPQSIANANGGDDVIGEKMYSSWCTLRSGFRFVTGVSVGMALLFFVRSSTGSFLVVLWILFVHPCFLNE